MQKYSQGDIVNWKSHAEWNCSWGTYSKRILSKNKVLVTIIVSILYIKSTMSVSHSTILDIFAFSYIFLIACRHAAKLWKEGPGALGKHGEKGERMVPTTTTPPMQEHVAMVARWPRPPDTHPTAAGQVQ